MRGIIAQNKISGTKTKMAERRLEKYGSRICNGLSVKENYARLNARILSLREELDELKAKVGLTN